MKPTLRWWLLAASLLLLNALGWAWFRNTVRAAGPQDPDRPVVRLLDALPHGDVDGEPHLVVALDRPLGEAGQPLARAPFTLEPPLAGRWEWVAPDRLGLRLDAPPPPGRVLRATPSDAFEDAVGAAPELASVLEWTTRRLAVRSVRVRERDAEGALLELRFSQPVTPKALARALTVAEDGVDLEVRVLGDAPGELQRARVDGDAVVPTLRLAADLTPAGGERGLGAVHEQRLDLPPPPSGPEARGPAAPRKLSAHASCADLEPRATVVLRFDRPLDLAQELPRVSLEPPVEDLDLHLGERELRLSGDLSTGAAYRVRVEPGLLARGGGATDEALECTVEVPRRDATLRLPEDGVLSTAGHLALTLQAVNVPRVHVRAWRVHEGNLVDHARGEGPRDTARLLLDEVRELGGTPERPERLALDLPSLVDAPRGVYRIELRDPEHYWTRASCTVRLSDLALTVKDAPGELVAWTVGLSDARPREDVVVSAWTRNEQLLARARTDARGVARLALPEDLPDGGPYLVTAALDGDVNLVRPGSRHWVLEGVPDTGRPWPGDRDALLYAERGVHAPGDAVHVTALLRGRHGEGLPDTELRLRLIDPEGRAIASEPLTCAAALQGFGHADLVTPREGPTGPWALVLETPEGERLARETLLVEDFLPVHLRLDGTARAAAPEEPAPVEAAAPRSAGSAPVEGAAAGADLARGASAPRAVAPAPVAPVAPGVQLELEAAHLLGRPASGLRARISGHVRPVAPRVDGREGFTFARADAPARGGRLPVQEAALDEDGRLSRRVPLPTDLDPGLYEVHLDTSVQEPGGRAVNRRVTTTVDLAGRHLGVRAGARRVPGESLVVDWCLVDRAGADVEPDSRAGDAPEGDTRDDAASENDANLAPLRLELVRLEARWEPRWHDGRARWERREERSLVDAVELREAHGTWSARVGDAGAHELVALDRVTGVRTVLRLGIWGQGGAAPDEGPDRLVLRALDGPLVPGRAARFELTAPFAGTALVTLEGDGVRSLKVLEWTAPRGEVELDVPADLLGGATVVASVVRALDPGALDWRPHRARGALRVESLHADRALPLALEVPDEARPRATVPVTVRTEPGAAVHLWAVDEGILLASASRVPDPFTHFTGPRRTAVRTADVHDELLPDLARPEAVRRVGGDADEPALLRPEALEPREEPAVVWRGAALADEAGELSVDVALPDLVGSLRWMAVAAHGPRFAADETNSLLTTPVSLTLSAPRAVAPGDAFEATLSLFETRGQGVVGEVTVLDDAGRLLAGPTQGVELEPGASLVLRLPLTVPEADGADGLVEGGTRLRVRFQGRDDTGAPLAEEASAGLVVRPAEGVEPWVEARALVAGEALELDPFQRLRRGRGELRLRVQASPELELEPAFDALVGYPHGCAEQTSSRLLALLLHPRGAERFPGWIDQGLRRLRALQTPSGGLAYWIGGDRAQVWVSCHAARVVCVARERGVAVDEGFAARLTDYLERRLLEGDGDAGLQADLVRALAGLGRPQPGWTARLFERRDELDLDARAQLARACLAVDRREEARRLLESVDPATLSVVARAEGRMVFRAAALGRWLDAWLDLDPDDPQVARLVDLLLDLRREGRWGNTLSDALCLGALARASAGRPAADWSVTVHGLGKDPVEARADEPLDVIVALADLTGPLRLESRGDGTARVLVEARGLRRSDTDDDPDAGDPDAGAADAAIADAGAPAPLRVRRTYLDAEGEPLDLDAVRAGDLVRVELRLDAPGLPEGASVPNVAVVDLLPGGFQVENPRLATGFAGGAEAVPGRARAARATRDGVPDPVRPEREGRADRVEFLADRVLLFTRVRATTEVYRYALRAVGPGAYRVPPAVAESMYEPGVHGRTEGGTLRVVR